MKKLSVKWYSSSMFRLVSGVLLIILLGFATVANWISQSQRRAFVEHATHDASVVSIYIKDRIEKEMLAGEKLKNIRPLIDGLVLNGKVDKIMLLNLKGVVRHSSNHKMINSSIILQETEGCIICHKDLSKTPANSTVLTKDKSGKKVIRTKIPIVNQVACHACHPADKKYRAILIIDSTFTELEQSLNLINRKLYNGLKFVSLFIFASLLIYLNIFFSRPLNRLMLGIKQIIKGNLSYKIYDKGTDEFAAVSRAFNYMVYKVNNNISDIKQKNLELNSLYSIIDQLSRTMDLEKLRKIIIEIFFKMFDIETVYMLTYTFHKNEVELIRQKRNKAPNRYIGDIITDIRNQIIEITDTDLDSFVRGKFLSPKVAPNNKNIIVPLLIKGEPPFGFVLVTKETTHFHDSEIRTIIAISHHISVAVTNARLYSLSITDELTKLYTKRYLTLRTNEEVQRHFRYKEIFSLLIIDIDKFKEINDTYGHLAGDIVLKHFAQAIKKMTRVMDTCSRYGGDEFIILLPEADKTYAYKVAEKIRKAIEELTIKLEDGTQIQITLSVGVSSCPAHGNDFDLLLSCADKALYKSKELGRNRSTLFDEA